MQCWRVGATKVTFAYSDWSLWSLIITSLIKQNYLKIHFQVKQKNNFHFLLQVEVSNHCAALLNTRCLNIEHCCAPMSDRNPADLVVVVHLQHKIFSAMHGFSQMTASLHVFDSALAKKSSCWKDQTRICLFVVYPFLVSSFKAVFCNFCIIYFLRAKVWISPFLALTLPQPAVERVCYSGFSEEYCLNIRYLLSLWLEVMTISFHADHLILLLIYLDF